MASRKTPPDSLGMGKRIRDAMTKEGLTQKALEEAIGASRGYLSRIISGSRGQKISPEYLTSLASVLRVSPNFLRWGTEIDHAAIMTPSAGLSPRLDEIEGYREAEFEVIRK
jgi:transcriptional regulator with XRE-family HTH domain